MGIRVICGSIQLSTQRLWDAFVVALIMSRRRFHLLEGRLSAELPPGLRHRLAQCRHRYRLLVDRKVEDLWFRLTLV